MLWAASCVGRLASNTEVLVARAMSNRSGESPALHQFAFTFCRSKAIEAGELSGWPSKLNFADCDRRALANSNI
jgi:hypothetical protein